MPTSSFEGPIGPSIPVEERVLGAVRCLVGEVPSTAVGVVVRRTDLCHRQAGALHTVAVVVVEHHRPVDKVEEIGSGSHIVAEGGSRSLFDTSRFSFEHGGLRGSERRMGL